MSKPAVILVLAAAALALAVVFVVFAHPDTQSRDGNEKQESTAAPTPSVPAEARRQPSPLLPANPPKAPGRQEQEAAGGGRLDEASLVAKLRDLAASDPSLSLTLAKDAVARFSDSPNAPEFEWNVVKALANMERYKEAEQEALVLLRKYPNSPFADDVEHHLLNHPPNPASVPGQ